MWSNIASSSRCSGSSERDLLHAWQSPVSSQQKLLYHEEYEIIWLQADLRISYSISGTEY